MSAVDVSHSEEDGPQARAVEILGSAVEAFGISGAVPGSGIPGLRAVATQAWAAAAPQGEHASHIAEVEQRHLSGGRRSRRGSFARSTSATLTTGPASARARHYTPAVPTTMAELTASTVGEFMAVLRQLHNRSGVTRNELVRRTGIPSSSLYKMLEPDRLVLPQKNEHLQLFLEACGLDSHGVQQMLRVWSEIYDQERTGSPSPAEEPVPARPSLIVISTTETAPTTTATPSEGASHVLAPVPDRRSALISTGTAVASVALVLVVFLLSGAGAFAALAAGALTAVTWLGGTVAALYRERGHEQAGDRPRRSGKNLVSR